MFVELLRFLLDYMALHVVIGRGEHPSKAGARRCGTTTRLPLLLNSALHLHTTTMSVRAILLHQLLIDYAPLGVLSNEVVVSGVERPTLANNVVHRVSLRY